MKKLRVMMCLLVAVSLLAGCAAKKSAAEIALEKQVQEYQNQIAAGKAGMDDLNAKLNACKMAEEQDRVKITEYKLLTDTFALELAAASLEISALADKVQIRLPETVLFDSDKAVIHAKGREVLKKVADQLKGVKGKLFLVEGHTDNVPCGPKSPFKNNYDLSYARALAVVNELVAGGMSQNVLEAGAFSEYQPIATNATADGRKKNRRIEIELMPLDPIYVVPAPAPAAPAGK